MTSKLPALSLVEEAEMVQVCFTPCLRDQRTNGVCECKVDVESTWIPTWHPNGSCFMVTWTILKNHLLEVGLTQNRETMALQMLVTVDLLCFNMCEDPRE